MIQNRNTATERHASGYITPYFRLATHLGYCYGVASNTAMPWDDRKRDISLDLAEALRHISDAREASAYVSIDTCTELQSLYDDILAIQTGEATEEDTLAALIAASHNAAYAMSKMEHDMIGYDASAGTEI
jgi:hypothetical protein